MFIDPEFKPKRALTLDIDRPAGASVKCDYQHVSMNFAVLMSFALKA